MSVSLSSTSVSTRAHLRRAALLGGLSAGALALTACGAASTGATQGGNRPSGTEATTASRGTDPVDETSGQPGVVRLNVARGASAVPVDRVLHVRASHATITGVAVTSAAGAVRGTTSTDGASWQAEGLLEPAAAYTVRTQARAEDGSTLTRTAHFRTQVLSLDQQTYPTVAPAAGQTVGVGMPVVVHFDVPVTDKAAFQRHMHVTSAPAQQGSWHWMSDTEAHWRPKTYWKAGTDVHVAVDVNGVAAGNGIFGQESRDLDFHIGSANIYRIDAHTDQMRVFSNGKLLRTIPITTGKPGFTTRSGIKVIVEKYTDIAMNSETVGITGSEAYNLDDVKYAMRLTYSGEFIHAAPWSVASQGHENVSHGCTGMSTEDAEWLFGISKPGDVVVTTGTDKPMTLDNGYGDWNASFATYVQGSALS